MMVDMVNITILIIFCLFQNCFSDEMSLSKLYKSIIIIATNNDTAGATKICPATEEILIHIIKDTK